MSEERPARAQVDPALMFGISLGLSLLLWYPTLHGALDGSIDITVAGLRYLASLGLSWVAVFAISTLVSTYGHEEETSTPPELPPGRVEHPLRRADDQLAETPEILPAEEPAA
jgi:hypothetical protein